MDRLNFERFLLFHPQTHFTYIRKLSMSYGYYTALAVVNDNDRVTHVGVSNSFQIVPFKELTNEDKNILGSDRCNSLESDDLLSVYRINRALKLNGSYKLHRPCRNMRYTTFEESYDIKRLMQSTLDTKKVEVKIQKNIEYDTPYSDKVEINLWDIDFSDILKDGDELPQFHNSEVSGQTKLI